MDDIDNMPAGQPLDWLVAEEVMGYKDHPWQDPIQIHAYSTDNAAAIEVAEKMCSEGWEVSFALSGKLPSDDAERAYCNMTYGDDNAPWKPEFRCIQVWAPMLPLAICLAALKAKRSALNAEATHD